MTTKEIGKFWEQEANRSQLLWKTAAFSIARICRSYHRARARKRCLRIAQECKALAVSVSYARAAKMLLARCHVRR